MKTAIVYSSEYIEITKKDDGFYIESFKKGMMIDTFNKIIGSHPEIQVLNFSVIRDALIFSPQPAKKFANIKDRIIVDVSADEMKAYITLNVSDKDLNGTAIIKEIVSKLNQEGIIFGIKKDALLNLYSSKPILIAEGLLPEPGKDSLNRLYQLKEIKPEIKEDGNVDHYELNLINMVQKGEWLGEKINATDGIDGRTVRGNIVKSLKGKNYPILYDKKTVTEVSEDNKITLYAIRSGAVFFEGDKISVSNHLEIKEDVGVKTGNVDFDGYLTVKGTIEDNYSVVTTKDIEILGEYGVGSVKEISSEEGSVYIKGGITGKGKTIIKCKKNLYIKYVADADIICEGSVHVGFYCLNSNINAKELILDSPKGQIIGGKVNAVIRVVSSILGSGSEKRTSIYVKGFERYLFKADLDVISERIDFKKSEVYQVKQQLAVFSHLYEGGQVNKSEFDKLNEKYSDLKAELKDIEDKKRQIIGYLKTKGEGEVSILKRAYPNTSIQIKSLQKEIQKTVLRVTYYYSDGFINEI